MFKRKPLLNEFETELTEKVLSSLEPEDVKTLTDQLSKFNDVYREPKLKGVNRQATNLYWKKLWKISRDFPLVFDASKEEEKLAHLLVDTSEGKQIEVTFWLVHGAMFSIEFVSKDGTFEPESSFVISSIDIFPDRD